MTVCRFFVYGTLKRNERREHAWLYPPLSIVKATTHGRLFDLGSYPAMTVGQEVVEGEVWQVAEEHLQETLRTLDAIEGYVPAGNNNLYERRVVEYAILCNDNAFEDASPEKDAHENDTQKKGSNVHQAWTYFYVQALSPEQWIRPDKESGRVSWSAN